MGFTPALYICPARFFVFYSTAKWKRFQILNTAQPPLIQPQANPKPVSITVFGILNIVFGAFGLLCAPFGLVVLFAMPNGLTYSAAYKVWMIVSFLVDHLHAEIQPTGGI